MKFEKYEFFGTSQDNHPTPHEGVYYTVYTLHYICNNIFQHAKKSIYAFFMLCSVELQRLRKDKEDEVVGQFLFILHINYT